MNKYVGALIVIVPFFFLPVIVNGQFFDKLTNPTINVTLSHPPGLGLKVKKIAFGPASGNCADQVIESVVSDLVSSQIEVIDRQNLNSILAEHNFSLTGYVDQTTTAAMGKILGPSALIFIKVQRCTAIVDKLYDTETKYNYTTKRNYTVTAYYARTRAFLKVSIQTVDLASGRIFSAQNFDYSPERKNKSYDGYPEAPSEFDVQDIAFRSFVSTVHRMFVPWSESVELVYYDDNKGGLKEAYQALKSNDVDRALELSKQNIETCKSIPNVKDKLLGHAYYNLGMSYMIKDDFDEAIKYFREAAKLNPGDIVNNSIAECVRAKDLMIAMQKVEQKASFEAEKEQVESTHKANMDVANTLTNEDIIKLSHKKISEAIIIQKIKVSKCNFNTGTEALTELTKSGVSEKVIIAMMEK